MQRQDRILIVDDNPVNVAILEEMLGDGYHLTTATSGEEALALTSDVRPDLILLDIMMPGIDGYETCRRIRATPALRHTKIIMVSAKALVAERLQGYKAGADDYVTKPFEEEELLAKVRVYLRLKSVEEVDQLKYDILALLGHETRTPLSTIITPVRMLMADDDMDTEERAMLLRAVHDSAKRLQRLFEQVLKLSRMKSGAWEFEFVTAELNDVVRSAVYALTTQASERNVHIEQILPDAATTLLDLEQMLAVITAILENAVRFSPPGERVVVRVWHDGDGFCVAVTDQGAGIDPDVLPQMFDEYAYANLAYHTEGQGFSLAIAREVVQAHDGRIEVASTPGAGTTFTVHLPIATSSDSARQVIGVETI
jgi:two-component system sensor histidine kinase/response regulator